jgi:hypothetical protein
LDQPNTPLEDPEAPSGQHAGKQSRVFRPQNGQVEVVAGSSPRSTRHTLRGAGGRFRSQQTNEVDRIAAVDGRSALARRFRDIVSAILTDQGGGEDLSEMRFQLIRRFGAAAVLAEQLEAKMANGEQIDIAEHAQLCSSLVRLGQRIGIDRVPRNVSPSLHDILHDEASS